MRKARSSKEKPADLEVAPEESTGSAPRRKGGRRRRDPEATESETNGVEAEEAKTPLRPVLTAISRPVRD
ncbi:MAG TPA: transcription termination factor Rho, partial [Myxococcaceae bacterium]|nr:transcription termination factor Rho [Myxococcaceae bacterium]